MQSSDFQYYLPYTDLLCSQLYTLQSVTDSLNKFPTICFNIYKYQRRPQERLK